MKISEAAKILGISTDTIRYYEKEGIISPKRINKNSYRDLDNKDIVSLLSCLYNRKIGYSIKESVEYAKGIPITKVTNILNNRIHELERQINETKNIIDYLSTLKIESVTDFYNIGNYWITIEPKRYLLPYALISHSEFHFTVDDPKYYSKLFEYIPFICMGQIADAKNLYDPLQNITEWFFIIPENVYNQIPKYFLKDIKIISRQHCLNTVVINENWEYPSTEIFKDVSIYLKKNNIKSCGIATAIYPNYYFQKNEKKERYAKIIIPVELD